jgi:isopentenyl diphosphate isomerase/L-lactate dehydrogenase-like FMN-dependent dehydrogenase
MAAVVHSSGDLAGARAAAAAGTIFIQSTMSNQRIEDVVEAAAGSPVWYQVYRVGPRSRVEAAIDRARIAGVAALVITFDTAVLSLRVRESGRMRSIPNLLRLTGKPRWLRDRLAHGLRLELANVIQEDGTPQVLGQLPAPASLTWEDLSWVKERFGGPIIVKGLLTADDAVRAVNEGAAAVIVSNHGGRQLDTAEATLRALPEIVAAVDGRCEVLLDGGIRSGTDVIKALSLGAHAVLVGRPWLFGLASGGEPGVRAVIEVLREGLQRNLALVGVQKISELDRTYVRLPAEWTPNS